MEKNNIHQRKLLYDYNKASRVPFNPALFQRNEDDIIEELKKLILSCQRYSNFILLVNKFTVVDKYEDIITILKNYKDNLYKGKSGKSKKDNQYDFINLKETKFKLLIVQYYIEVKGQSKIQDVIICVPRVVNKYYFKILGNMYLPLLQIVDASTYNNSTSNTNKNPMVVFRTAFMPIRIIKKVFSITLSNGEVMDCNIYHSRIFNKSFGVMKYLFARFGYFDTLSFLSMNNVQLTKYEITDPDYYCFKKKDNDNIYISVPKLLFDNDSIVQSIVHTIFGTIHRKTTYDEMFEREYWLLSLASEFSSSNIKKGISLLISLEGLYDIKSHERLKLPEEEKSSIYHVIRWCMRSFNDLKNRSNMDLAYKRVRWSEYIPTLYTMKLATGIYRISDNNRLELKSVLKVINIDPMFLIKSITKCSLITIRSIGNDLDSEVATKFTFKEIASIGETVNKNVATVLRYVDDSYLGRLDLDSSSKSDPGRTGILTPFVQLDELGYFEDYQEPNGWQDEYNKLIEEFNALKGRKELATFKKQVLDINPTIMINTECEEDQLKNLVRLATFTKDKFESNNIPLEEGGLITYE